MGKWNYRTANTLDLGVSVRALGWEATMSGLGNWVGGGATVRREQFTVIHRDRTGWKGNGSVAEFSKGIRQK